MIDLKKFVYPFVVIVLLIVFMEIMKDKIAETEMIESGVKESSPVIEMTNQQITQHAPRPKKGISLFINQSITNWTAQFGKQDRIEPSMYGYDWYVYKQLKTMVGVDQDGKVNQIFTMNEQMDISPFQMNESIESILTTQPIESEITIPIGESRYTFSLNQEEVTSKFLIPFNQVQAQVYIDTKDKEIQAVRFINNETLVLHQPYDMFYEGKLIRAPLFTTKEWVENNRAVERQLVDLTNWMRIAHGQRSLASDYQLTVFARKVSEQLALPKHIQEQQRTLKERLVEEAIKHQQAGETVASSFVDPIEVVHSFLTSDTHREVFLHPQFTHIGTGTHAGIYVVEYITRADKDISQ